jgi:hypothetical protein
MANIEIKAVLRDEVTRSLNEMQASLKKFEREARLTEAHSGIEKTTAAVQRLSHEFGSVLKLFGAGRGPSSAAVSLRLWDGQGPRRLSQKRLQLHHLSRELGVTTEFLSKWSAAGQDISGAVESCKTSKLAAPDRASGKN